MQSYAIACWLQCCASMAGHSEVTLIRVAEVGVGLELKRGQHAYRANDVADRVYVVVDGTVELWDLRAEDEGLDKDGSGE